MLERLPAHSPLGASGAYRWLPPPYGGGCYASVQMSAGVDDPESDYAALGTAAHALGAYCLIKGSDAWEYLGHFLPSELEDCEPYPHDVLPYDPPDDDVRWVTKEMADAVQVYLDAVRRRHPDQNQGNTWVERRFHCSEIHELFYGTADFVHWDPAARELHVWDYKHGAGVVVEVPHNPQCMYYGLGALTDLSLWDEVDQVVLHIAQPRGFHYDGPVRDWAISVEDLAAWRDLVLVPGMDLALVSRDTASGSHCRFCPVRYRDCPQHAEDMRRMEELMNAVAEAPKATAEQLGEFLSLFEIAKIRQKAWREAAFARAEAGNKIPGWKIAKARSNREFKDGAEKAAKKAFGKAAFTEPVLKSPNQIEALPKGEAFTSQWAFKPDKGNQLVQEKDARPDAGPDKKSMFKPVGKKGGKK